MNEEIYRACKFKTERSGKSMDMTLSIVQARLSRIRFLQAVAFVLQLTTRDSRGCPKAERGASGNCDIDCKSSGVLALTHLGSGNF